MGKRKVGSSQTLGRKMENKYNIFLILATWCLIHLTAYGQASDSSTTLIQYGDNEEIGKYAEINGIEMYYEVYGEGEPLLLIHGNGSSIGSFAAQISHFSKSYRVIAADSRGRGKSSLGVGELTYRQMTDDSAALLDHLKIDSAKVIGWSDGAIIGFLLGIHHPNKVQMLAAMGGSLQPDTSAVYPWALEQAKKDLRSINEMIEKGDSSKDWKKERQIIRLLIFQPDISLVELQTIQSPVLVMSGDRDIIREEHSVLIAQNIPNSHLCIFPGQTHWVPKTDPKLFNTMVDSFFGKPFTRPESRKVVLGLE